MGADLYRQGQKHHICGFERSEDAISKGYFRDAYNEASILNKFDLSWWKDISPLCNEEGVMSYSNVVSFRDRLDDELFEKNIEKEPQESKVYYREGANLLKKYLDETIKLKKGIECSL